MKWLICLTLISCNLNPAVINNNKGNVDTGAPTPTITTTISDPVLSDSVLCYCTFDKGPITGFTSGDVTLTNCTLTSFTQISGNVWTFYLNPTIDGTFTAKVNAGTCAWTSNTGTSVSNLVSNTLSKVYDSGASYDLQNAAYLGKLDHYRGHTWSISITNDLLNTLSRPGMELLVTKYNFGATMFCNANNVDLQNMYNFGRTDLGVISNSFADFQARYPLVTSAMGGRLPTTLGYKNGVYTYADDLIPYILWARNSLFSGPFKDSDVPPSYNYWQYTGLTVADMKARGITFRHDYGDKLTGTDYYICSNARRDANLSYFVSYVYAQGGWMQDFAHWHWQVGNYPKHFYALWQSLITSLDAFCGTQTQVAEYYFVRESVTSVTATGNTITVNHAENFVGSPYASIETPLWVKIDLTGTVFAGHDISLSNGMRPRSMGSNVFYIPIVLDYSGSSSTVSLGIATGAPDYVNLSTPVLQRTGNTITCDQPVKYKIWRVPIPISLSTSISSATIPTADNTTINLTIGTGLTIAAETQVRVKYDANNYFFAWITSYDSGTGAAVLSSFPDAVGSGTYSSWTIDTYYHEVEGATEVEGSYTFATSYTIQAVLDETNFTYYVGVINRDGISALTP